jgi:hypothetical protein
MSCSRQFQNHSQKERIEQVIWKEYIYQRQTIQDLALKYGKSKNWIRDRLRNVSTRKHYCNPQPVVVIADVTFFGRSFGLCVMRAPHLKKNIYVQEVQTESVDVYRQGMIELERRGYTILAIVLDGRPGVRQLFSHIPVQMRHFHQKQIITRYLTNNPKLPAGIELKMITATLCETNETAFTSALRTWHTQWSSFLKERTTDPLTGKWRYTHKRLRSAYRSLKTNLPCLFIYQKYPQLNIPNTTNSLDGCFAYLKELVRVHRGSTRVLKSKIIDEILWR